MRTRIRLASLALCALLFTATSLHAEAIMLAWDANTDPNLSGYIVEYGTAAAPFTTRVVLGTQTIWTLTGAAPATTYWFRVRAYNTDGLQSDPSDPVSWTTAAGPGGCTTPDPFSAMGGGTCYNRGWLPPGMSPPSSTPPPPPPSSSGGCTTPDPFASMGGGTCYNGGWLPPGDVPPSGAPASTPPPPPPPPPSTPPPTTSGGCVGPDPFAAMGGGTCSNGGWLPPGYTAPPATSPTPPPPPTPPPTTSGCVGPDPFAALGGGTCYNRGWLPPGMTPPGGTSTPPAPPPVSTTGCKGTNPFAGMAGLIGACYNSGWYPVQQQAGTVRLINSTWVIVGSNGTTYQPTTPLATTFQTNGLAVNFAGVPVITQNGVTLISLAMIAAR